MRRWPTDFAQPPITKFATFWIASLTAAVLLTSSPIAAAQAVANTADGESFVGRLTGVDSNLQVLFTVGSEQRPIAARDLVSWGTRRDFRRGPIVFLAGGSALQADVMALEREHLILDSLRFGRIEAPLEMVRGVIFRFASDPAAVDRLVESILHSEAKEDTLFLTNGEEASGVLSPTALPNNALAAPLTVFLLETPQGRAFVPTKRIVAARFNPALVVARKTSRLQLALGFTDGALLRIAGVEQRDGMAVFKLACGLELVAEIESPLPQATWLQSFGGRAVYLSDLTPISYKHIPFFDQSWTYGQDRNLSEGMLRVGGIMHSKGICLHSTSRLAYRTPKGATRFEADIGIDDAAGGGGSVRFRVYTLGEGNQWGVAYESPIVRGGQPARPIQVELDGARALALIVDYADRGDQQDHADWLGARFITDHK